MNTNTRTDYETAYLCPALYSSNFRIFFSMYWSPRLAHFDWPPTSNDAFQERHGNMRLAASAPGDNAAISSDPVVMPQLMVVASNAVWIATLLGVPVQVSSKEAMTCRLLKTL